MWESAKTIAPTPNSIIARPDVDDNFVINNTHINMIQENKFDGQLWADPHDHIREFLAICDMFKYSETQSEAVKLLIFPFSMCDKAKTWFNELNEESITSWEQMRRVFINRFFPPSLFNRLLLKIRSFSQLACKSLADALLRLNNMLRKCHGHGLTKGAIIQIFYLGLDKPTQRILDITVGGIFVYKSLNQAFQFLEDKVLFILDWSTKSQNDHHQESVAFTDSHHDLDDCEKSLTELNNDVKNDLEDFKRCIHSMRTDYDKLYEKEPQPKTDLEKLITKFSDSQRVTNMFFKTSVNAMILKMKPNEKNFKTIFKNMERKLDGWEKSQNVSSEQTKITNPSPPQAQAEQVNVVFTESGKSDDSFKIQKDPPPPIIVNNKIKKDRPIKTSKRNYHVVETKEYPFGGYIPKV
uniref:Reverse transcriptase domain-containing protein n=1 Tax=Tanacetum cinerariifolium TaxID=118510 RepID=A0A6L2KYT0_TANCI|nr:reverse transcriptase domain-containing protein [Tanacetum cinerariifolium]